MSERNYYVLCDDNCRFESMTKEQILAAITQAVESHEIADVDTGFVTTIKEQNANKGCKLWIGTTAQFNAIATKAADTLYILSDDDTEESIESAISILQTSITNIVSGATTVGKATNATTANKLSTETIASPFSITKAGLYAVSVFQATNQIRFSVLISIEDLSKAISVANVGTYHSAIACEVYYNNGGNGKITVVNYDQSYGYTVESVRLITEY